MQQVRETLESWNRFWFSIYCQVPLDRPRKRSTTEETALSFHALLNRSEVFFLKPSALQNFFNIGFVVI
jgi:hypothetical protein